MQRPMSTLGWTSYCCCLKVSVIAPPSAAAAAPVASTSGPGNRQWSNRRRPRPARPLRTAYNQAAAEKIAAAAELKATYYKEKLAMKRQQHEMYVAEHARRMKVFELKEQIAAKQLRQMEEWLVVRPYSSQPLVLLCG